MQLMRWISREPAERNREMDDAKEHLGLSLVLPVYNEVQAIRMVLEELLAVFSRIENPVELIVVDDGSTDRSSDVLECFSDRIRVFRHATNRGYGAAIKTGIRHAVHPLIAITDADGTYPNQLIPELVRRFAEEDVDMVVGARTGKNVYIPALRKPAKWAINMLASYLCEMKIPDLNSGLRIMKKVVIEDFLHLLPDGFSFTSTVTLAMLTNGYSTEYVEIDYCNRVGKSKIRPIKDTLNFLQLVVRMTMYFRPLRVFIPLSMFLAAFAFAVLIGSHYILGEALDVSFGVLMMTAVMFGAAGMLADLINKRIR